MLSEQRDSVPDLFASTVSRKPREPEVEIEYLEMSEVVPDADNRFVGLREVKLADDSKFFSDKKPMVTRRVVKDSPDVVEADDVPVVTQSQRRRGHFFDKDDSSNENLEDIASPPSN